MEDLRAQDGGGEDLALSGAPSRAQPTFLQAEEQGLSDLVTRSDCHSASGTHELRTDGAQRCLYLVFLLGTAALAAGTTNHNLQDRFLGTHSRGLLSIGWETSLP